MIEVTLVDGLVSVALYVAAGGFFAAGLFLLGKGHPKELATLVLSLAVLQVITIGFLFAEEAVLQAYMVVIFAYIWFNLAGALFLETDLKVLSHHLVVAGVAYAAITGYLIAGGVGVMLPVMTASYTLIIFLLAAGVYLGAKMPWLPKLNGWILIIEAFVTVLYPSLSLLFGIPLP